MCVRVDGKSASNARAQSLSLCVYLDAQTPYNHDHHYPPRQGNPEDAVMMMMMVVMRVDEVRRGGR